MVLRALAFGNENFPSQTLLRFHGVESTCTGTLSQSKALTLETLEQPVAARQSVSCEWLLPVRTADLSFQRVSQLCALHGQDQWEPLRLTLSGILGYSMGTVHALYF